MRESLQCVRVLQAPFSVPQEDPDGIGSLKELMAADPKYDTLVTHVGSMIRVIHF